MLRGAGRDHTNLRFTKSMVDLHGWGTNHTAGQGRSKYTWAGAMISNKQDKGVFAPNVNLHLGQVAKPAKRGDTRIYVNQLVRNASSAELLFQPGQWYTLALAENAQVRTRQCAGCSVLVRPLLESLAAQLLLAYAGAASFVCKQQQ